MDLFPLEEKMSCCIELHEVPAKEGHEVLWAKGFRILSAPVKHGGANIALRAGFDLPSDRGTVALACPR